MTALLAFIAGCGVAGGLLMAGTGLFTPPPARVARPPSPLKAALARPWKPGVRNRTAAGAGVGVVVLVLTRWPAAAAAAGVAAVALPRLMSGAESAQQMARLEAIEQWIRKLSGLLGASRGLEDALQTSAAHTPAPIRDEIHRLARRLRGGMDPADALYRLADDLADPVGDLVAVALIEASEVRGRGVQHLLQELAAMVAADVAGRREVEASRAPHRTTVKGMTVIFIVFGVLLAWRRDYSAAYGTPLGQLVLAVLLGICGGGLYVMYRLAHQTPVQRFLNRPQPAAPSQVEEPQP